MRMAWWASSPRSPPSTVSSSPWTTPSLPPSMLTLTPGAGARSTGEPLTRLRIWAGQPTWCPGISVSNNQQHTNNNNNNNNRYYEASRDFMPGEVVVVTWDTVGYFDMKTDKVRRLKIYFLPWTFITLLLILQTNMFQLIIASNDKETYSVFLFPESGVEWVRGSGKNRWMNVSD